MKIDLAWALQVLALHLPSDPTVWDPSGVEAAIARHASDLTMRPAAQPHDAAWRAAALLHTLTVCPPLDSPMNEFYAASMSRAYLHQAGARKLPSPHDLVDIITEVKADLDVYAAADRIRVLTA